MDTSVIEPLESNASVSAAQAPASDPAPAAHVPCPSCGSTSPPSSAAVVTGRDPSAGPVVSSASWVYAIGRIEPRFPRISVEKEFLQVVAQSSKLQGMSDAQVRHHVLSSAENAYLLRQMCWVLTIQGQDTYILTPRDPIDLRLLAHSVRTDPGPGDLDIVIGAKGPVAPSPMCNGLQVPIVFFDQIYSFDRESLLKELPRPEGANAKGFAAAAAELFDRMMLLAANPGSSNRTRAFNYLAARYPRLYHAVAEAHDRDESLTAVDVRSSSLSGAREIVDVVLSFTNRRTDVISKQFVRVDVTDEFPFLVTKLSPYYDC
jgi:hypothetical protein